MITNNMIEVIDVGVFETEKGIEKIEEATEAPKKKKGFFGRLFG